MGVQISCQKGEEGGWADKMADGKMCREDSGRRRGKRGENVEKVLKNVNCRLQN